MGNNDHRYNTNTYAGDQAADTRRVLNHMPDEDRVSTQDLQQSINSSQAAELGSDVRMGDDRVIGDTPNWASYDSKQLYNFATQNNSPYTADDLGRAFNDGGNGLAEAANGLLDAVSRLDGAWTGVAADSAKAALQPLAKAAGVAGTTAQLMGVRMSQQSVAASEVRKMPPPKDFNQQQSVNAMLAGGPAAMQQDLKVQKDAAEAVKREQISYLTTYTQSMSAVDTQTPSFIPPEERIGGGSSGSGGFTGERVNIQTVGAATPNVHGATNDGSTTKNPGNTGQNGPGFTVVDPGTNQSGFNPGATTGASSYLPPSTQTPSTFGPSGGPLPGTSGGPGTGGPGFGLGVPGAAGLGGVGAGAGAGSGAGAGAGSNSAARPVAPTSMSPAGSAAGRGGSGMGGGARGKGEKDEDDKEHERPEYLVEGDPESTFGSDQMTAPPVIGGDD